MGERLRPLNLQCQPKTEGSVNGQKTEGRRATNYEFVTALLHAGLIDIDVLAERVAGLPRERVLPGFLLRAEGFVERRRAGAFTFLLLEQGDVDAASASIETALASIPGHALGRARLLPARVEVLLAAGDVAAAQDGASELGMIAGAYPTVALRAAALGAEGAVAAARGERSSLAQLRESWRLWRETPAPFEAARIGVLLARARLAAGDRGGALLEIDAAAAAFERLGAQPDLLRARALASELRGTA